MLEKIVQVDINGPVKVVITGPPAAQSRCFMRNSMLLRDIGEEIWTNEVEEFLSFCKGVLKSELYFINLLYFEMFHEC